MLCHPIYNWLYVVQDIHIVLWLKGLCPAKWLIHMLKWLIHTWHDSFIRETSHSYVCCDWIMWDMPSDLLLWAKSKEPYSIRTKSYISSIQSALFHLYKEPSFVRTKCPSSNEKILTSHQKSPISSVQRSRMKKIPHLMKRAQYVIKRAQFYSYKEL